jgi:hypothetical protein
MSKQKLELTWIGKEKRPKLEPRILLEDPEKSYHAKHRVSDNDIFDNRLIFGDNLLALKALEAEFAGKVKCVFIDPPYNTGSAFEHYDDGLEHSIWLGLMRDRLEIIKRLLSADGSLWIAIDDNEGHYLKGQFQIYYKLGTEQPEYIPDFVADTDATIFMVETKARADINTQEVQAKAAAAMRWCKHASDHAANVGTKPWKYLLVPHDEVSESKRLADYLRFEVKAN